MHIPMQMPSVILCMVLLKIIANMIAIHKPNMLSLLIKCAPLSVCFTEMFQMFSDGFQTFFL